MADKGYKAVSLKGANSTAVLRAADCFGRAMVHDPTFVWLTDGKRPGAATRFFLEVARMSLLAFPGQRDCWQLLPADGNSSEGEAEVAVAPSPAVVCIACEYPADYPGSWRLLCSGLLRVILAAPNLHVVRVMMRLMDQFDHAKHAFGREHGRFLYIACYGTAPEHQGRGRGSQLMKAVLATADERGIPTYLEANSVDSRRFYERHGFRTLGELQAGPGAPPVALMARLPPSTAEQLTSSAAA